MKKKTPTPKFRSSKALREKAFRLLKRASALLRLVELLAEFLL